MEKDNGKLLHDLSRMASSAVSTAMQAKNDWARVIKQNVETFIRRMNFVTKKEHDVVKKMVSQHSSAIKAIQDKVGLKSAPSTIKMTDAKQFAPKRSGSSAKASEKKVAPQNNARQPLGSVPGTGTLPPSPRRQPVSKPKA
jgi:BMFP domain-containing protein YqiC